MADTDRPDDWAWTVVIIGSSFLNPGQVMADV